jgi:drug/metabolite transporter (DMT)-like permease
MNQNPAWIVYVFIGALLMAGADVFVKLASGKVSNSLGVLVYGSCTFTLGLGWVLWQKLHGVTLHGQTSGLLASIAVGVSFALVTVVLYVTFASGAPISLVSPTIRLGGLLGASLIGLLLWHEPLTLRYIIGVVLACSGIYLIVTR